LIAQYKEVKTMGKIADRMKEAMGMGDMDDYPKLKSQNFQGSTVRKRDKIELELVEGNAPVGDVARYSIRVSNPQRGAVFFPIDKEEDIDKIVASMKTAAEKAKKALKEHEKVVDAYWDKKYKEREGKK